MQVAFPAWRDFARPDFVGLLSLSMSAFTRVPPSLSQTYLGVKIFSQGENPLFVIFAMVVAIQLSRIAESWNPGK